MPGPLTVIFLATAPIRQEKTFPKLIKIRALDPLLTGLAGLPL